MIVGFLVGLALVHALWVYFFIVGDLALTGFTGYPADADPDDALVDITISTGTGAAISIFALFLLGELHLLNMPGIAVCAIALPTLLILAQGLRARAAGTVLKSLAARIRCLLSWPWITSYVVALPTVALALLPPTAFDSTMYHYARAVDWAHSGAITVDPYLRWPLFAFNFELLFSAFFVFHLDPYVQFLTWLTFAWSTTGTYALTRLVLLRAGTENLAATLAGLSACVVFASFPPALQFATVGYIDVPAGFMFLAAMSSAVLAVRHFPRYAAAVAITGGSFLGFKLPLVGFAPLFILLIVATGLCLFKSRATTMWCILLFTAIAAPWYLTNLIAAGDPISPALNMFFGRADPFWIRSEYLVNLETFRQSGLIATLTRPLELFRSDAPAYSVLLLYVPLVVLAIRVYTRERTKLESTVIYFGVSYAIVLATLSSTMYGRYLLQFYDAYIVALSVCVFRASEWIRSRFHLRSSLLSTSVAFGAVILMAIPSAGSASTYATLQSMETSLPQSLARPKRYLSNTLAGYTEAADLINIVTLAGKSGHVLASNFEQDSYYFRQAGIVSIGDWFGPGRYADLRSAVQTGNVAAYLKHFNIVAAYGYSAAAPHQAEDFLTETERQSLVAQLQKAGFVDYSRLGDGISEFVRGDVLRRAEAAGFVSSAVRVVDLRRPAVDLLASFSPHGISGTGTASTPTGRGVVVLPWDSDDGKVRAITVISGSAYRVDGLTIGSHAAVSTRVAKPFAAGTDAIAWIDELRNGKRTRLMSVDCAPARGTEIGWLLRRVALPQGSNVSLIFGASSIASGGIADWIAFGDPYLQDATDGIGQSKSAHGSSMQGRPTREGQGVVKVAKNSAQNVAFSAVPFSASLARDGLLRATIRWTVPAEMVIEVHVNTADGPLFAAAGGSGSAETGSWVTKGMTFYLQDVSHGSPGRTIAHLTM